MLNRFAKETSNDRGLVVIPALDVEAIAWIYLGEMLMSRDENRSDTDGYH
jgi:hypothetical protein